MLRIRRFHVAAIVGLALVSSLFFIQTEYIVHWQTAALNTVVGAAGTCRVLPSTDDRFTLELCYSRNSCNAGTITVSAPLTDCALPNAPTTSNNSAEDSWTYANIGPHTFHLQLYGATRAAQEPATFLGPNVCSWRFEFNARVSGRLGFQVHHVYEDYHGFRNLPEPPPLSRFVPLIEHTPGFPDPTNPLGPTQKEHVFVPDFDMCTEPSLFGKHARGFTLPRGLARPLQKAWLTPDQAKSKATAPLCSRELPIDGVYRPAHPSDDRKSMIAYKGYVWEPEPDCQMDELPYYDTEPRDLIDYLTLHERTVLFLGDSHNRYAYYFMRSWYQQNWTYLLEPYRLKEEYSSFKRGRTHFEFVWDRFLVRAGSETQCKDFRRAWGEFDTIVISAAHHMAIADHGETPDYRRMFTTTDEYVQIVRDTMATILRRCLPEPMDNAEYKKPRVIWLGTPAYRPPYVKFRWDDHRTNTRLSIWSSRVEAMLRAEFPEVAIVDMFALTIPFVRETIDGLHFYGTDAAWPIALEVNHKIGMGRPRGWWESPSARANDRQSTFKLATQWPNE